MTYVLSTPKYSFILFQIETIVSSTLVKNNAFESLELSPNDWLIPSVGSIRSIYFYDIHQWSFVGKQSNDIFLNIEQLISSLEKLLDSYPILNGTLKTSNEKVFVEHKNGVVFVSTMVNIPLKELSLSERDFVYDKMIPSSLELINPGNLDVLFHVRHTRFQCGSVALGISLNHRVGDAHSYFQLIKDWVKLYQHSNSQPDVCHQRSLLQLSPKEIDQLQSLTSNINDRQNSSVKKSMTPSSKEIVVKNFRFSIDELTKMKSDALAHQSSNVDYLSTFEVLTAHIYQHVTLARQCSSDSTSKLYISTNIRPRLTQPILPSTYFGNALMLPHLQISISQLVGLNHIGLLASQIHDVIKKTNTEYIRTTFAWIQSQQDKQNIVRRWALNETDLIISAWNKMGMYSNGDFEKGTYPSRILLPTNTKFDGVSILFSTEIDDGSIDAVIGLEINAMKRLEQNTNFRKYRLE